MLQTTNAICHKQRSALRALPSRLKHRPLSLYLLQTLIFTLLLLQTAIGHAQQQLRLEAPESSNAGYFQLDWNTIEGVDFFQLLEADNPRFQRPTVIYKGPDLGSHLSGKANGDYYYRVIAIADGGTVLISNDAKVTVQHHPLSRALSFFAIGAVVFLAILFVILKGNRDLKQ